ncbi:988_t:CDS:1 [Ambispora leptoticha]|uniref:988_t:CDS:1 n=1 Tax=Ambispora leptoticha TaxID=144679 RepID=A0A9N9FAR9_9GLOM|nr:988_t:CDS:1 [Ambispora leptoticha]
MDGQKFVSEKEFREMQNCNKFSGSRFQKIDDFDSFHQSNLVGMPISYQNEQTKRNGMILSINGIKVIGNDITTISELRQKLQDKDGILPNKLSIVFAGRKLGTTLLAHNVKNENTLLTYNIKHENTLHLIVRLPGGGCVFNYMPSSLLDPQFDYDFTNIDDGENQYTRGGIPYRRPCGWQRFAIKVTGKYGDDDKWLGTDENSWPVSYHGTAKHNARKICEEGYLLSKGKRFLFGRGIYSTPDVNIAKDYATEFEFEGKKYIMIFQNRVNPMNLVKIEEHNYWISKEDKDVRPYGICIKRI